MLKSVEDGITKYVGKLNFYLSAVDNLVKSEDDQPSIGLLLCANKNKTVVEHALRDVNKPMCYLLQTHS